MIYTKKDTEVAKWESIMRKVDNRLNRKTGQKKSKKDKKEN